MCCKPLRRSVTTRCISQLQVTKALRTPRARDGEKEEVKIDILNIKLVSPSSAVTFELRVRAARMFV